MNPSRWAIGLVVVGLILLGLSFVVRPGTGVSAIAPPPNSTVPAMSLADQGQALFSAKGCASCHLRGMGGAPNLAHYKVNPEFVRVWLRDPAAVRPQTVMPNLNLSESEIDALIAFLEAQSQR